MENYDLLEAIEDTELLIKSIKDMNPDSIKNIETFHDIETFINVGEWSFVLDYIASYYIEHLVVLNKNQLIIFDRIAEFMGTYEDSSFESARKLRDLIRRNSSSTI